MFAYTSAVASRIFRGQLKTPTAATAIQWSNHRAWPWQCDFNWHLNNALYLRNAELARWQWFARTRQLASFYGQGMAFVVGTQQIVHTRAIPLNASYRIRTALIGADDGWLYVAQDFFLGSEGESAKQHAASMLVMAALMRDGKRVAPSTFFPDLPSIKNSEHRARVESLKQQSKLAVRARGGSAGSEQL